MRCCWSLSLHVPMRCLKDRRLERGEPAAVRSSAETPDLRAVPELGALGQFARGKARRVYQVTRLQTVRRPCRS